MDFFSIANIACIKFHLASESCAPPVPCFHCWHCLHKLPSRKWVMCTFCALFPLLTSLAWTLIQGVSHVHLLLFISIADIACMNSYPESELCAAPLLDFHCSHCLHGFQSSQWVAVPLLTLSPDWFLLLIYGLVCSYFNVLFFLHPIKTPTFHRHHTLTMSFPSNSM